MKILFNYLLQLGLFFENALAYTSPPICFLPIQALPIWPIRCLKSLGNRSIHLLPLLLTYSISKDDSLVLNSSHLISKVCLVFFLLDCGCLFEATSANELVCQFLLTFRDLKVLSFSWLNWGPTFWHPASNFGKNFEENRPPSLLITNPWLPDYLWSSTHSIEWYIDCNHKIYCSIYIFDVFDQCVNHVLIV